MTQAVKTPDWLVTVVKKDGKAITKLFLLNKKNKKTEVELNLVNVHDNALHDYLENITKSIVTSLGGYFVNKHGKTKKK